jgi:acetyltransferase-like isoleucine patch superfamily enzyme
LEFGEGDYAKHGDAYNQVLSHMIDDKDILKYLSIIEKSKSDKADVLSANGGPQPTNDILIDPSCDIRGIERMRFGKGVVIQKDCWLNIAFQNPDEGPMIEIDEGTNIGRRCTISAANKIIIGKYVLVAPNVFIADTHHGYQKIGVPIMHQGISTHEDQVTIGDETWIGINSVVMGNVTIGKHCVIGANSVVNKNIPDYCVAVGNPARVVKTFDVKTGQWVKVKGKDDLDRYLAARCEMLSDDSGKISKGGI